MAQQLIVDASKARQQFFKLLEIIEKEDKEVVVQKRGTPKVRIAKVTREKPVRTEITKRLKALEKLSKLGPGTTLEWERMKKIISTTHQPTFE